MKFYLKINDDWVAPDFNVDDNIGIQLYWTFDNLQNPTDYVGEYSYDFTLPFTKKNRTLFRNFEQMDSITSTTNTQVFHPNVLIPYIIHTTNDVISTGEAYMSEINEKGYVLNLQGSLCTAFTKLLNSGWNTAKAANDEDYFLFEDVDETLDKDLIYRMWTNDSPTFNLDPTFTDITQIMTAVPMHQGLYEDFDSKSRVAYYSGLNLYYKADMFSGQDIGDGLNEWQMQEFRSYEQSFAIYIQKLFAIYKDKCMEICGYDLVLDNRWYNETYEYLEKMVYVLGKINSDALYADNTYYNPISRSWSMPDRNYQQSYELNGIASHTFEYQFNPFNAIRGQVVEFEFENEISATFPAEVTNSSICLCSWLNPFIYTLEFFDENSTLLNSYQFAIFMLPDATSSSSGEYLVPDSAINSFAPSGMPCYIIRYTALEANANPGLHIFQHINYRFLSTIDGQITAKVSWHYKDNSLPFLSSYSTDIITYLYYYYPAYGQPYMSTKCTAMVNLSEQLRSGQVFTFEKCFGDINPFTILLKYTKLLGMLWVVDDYTKTITIKRRSDYFWDLINTQNNAKSPSDEEYKGFTNITDLVDFNSFKITPLAWDTRKVEFNYDECEEGYMSKYNDKYGRTYGSALVLTENYLNKDTKNLLCQSDYDTIAPSCTVQPFYTPYGYYLQEATGKLKCNAAPSSTNDSGEGINLNNNFYFRLANVNLSDNMHVGGYRRDSNGKYAYITDDLTVEVASNAYMWHNNKVSSMNDQIVRKMPYFSTVRNGYGAQFAAPYELYFDIPITLRPQVITTDPLDPSDFERLERQEPIITYIYDLEYKGYVEEVYNVNNKTLEVNAAINGELYRKLKNVPLVIIEDVAYLVTEIEGWNEHNDKTKLKLRQIWDYSKLMDNNHSGAYTPAITMDTIDGTSPEITPIDLSAVMEDETSFEFDISQAENPEAFVERAPVDPITP